jgi:hypothetical protein
VLSLLEHEAPVIGKILAPSPILKKVRRIAFCNDLAFCDAAAVLSESGMDFPVAESVVYRKDRLRIHI